MLIRYAVGLGCLLAATNMGLAAISVDANVSVDQASANAKVVTPTFSTTAGNELLLAFISTDWLSGPNTTVTGMTGGGWPGLWSPGPMDKAARQRSGVHLPQGP